VTERYRQTGKSKLSHATNPYSWEVTAPRGHRNADLEAAYMPSIITIRVIWWHRHHCDEG